MDTSADAEGEVPTLRAVLEHVNVIRQEMEDIKMEAKVASECYSRMEKSFLDGQSSPTNDELLEKRLSTFEKYIIQKVREEVAAAATSSSSASASASPGEIEELRSRCSQLQQANTILENKINALVSDFVVTNQSVRHEMKRYATQVGREVQRQRRETTDFSEWRSTTATRDDERMKHLVSVMAMLNESVDENRRKLDESQEQWHELMERMLVRLQRVEQSTRGTEHPPPTLCVCPQTNDIEAIQNRLNELSDQFNNYMLARDAPVPLPTSVAVNNDALAVPIASELARHVAQLRANSEKVLMHSLPPESESRSSLRRVIGNTLMNTNKNNLASRYFQAWLAWRNGREQLRKDNVLLGLFTKQRNKLEDLCSTLDAAVVQFSPKPVGAAADQLKAIETSYALLSKSHQMANIIQCFHALLVWARRVDRGLPVPNSTAASALSSRGTKRSVY